MVPSMVFPFKTTVVMVALCYVMVEAEPFRVRLARSSADVRACEFYPFSSFSMYATFSETPYFVFLTQEDGTKLALETQMGIHASDVKKAFERHLKALRKTRHYKGPDAETPVALREEAAALTLADLVRRPRVADVMATLPGRAVQLHVGLISRGESGIESKIMKVGALALP
jgi:hypothetical protein